jgi:F0F1-type ATP synthase delta subunit
MSSEKKHYFLVSGQVEYLKDTVYFTEHVNGVHISDTQELAVKNLGQVQTMLQMQFHQKYSRKNSRAPEITDVVIFAVSHLGLFSHEEFYAEAPK